jgi:hypothetical protein
MCNCGNKRTNYVQEELYQQNVTTYTEPNQKKQENKLFKYIGKTALTVKGIITGNVYRFAFVGQTVEVDYRDVAAMYAVPVLKLA